MCGFVAIIGNAGQAPAPHVLRVMTESIHHRGPDDTGTFVENNVGLGFRRLSILDLAPSGHQPMLSSDGRHVIVFNGEIFNYVELRAELQALGHVFRSSGDTEVLLGAFRQWGPQCLERLNGMWAFVILDRTTGALFGARDRFGVKPLFAYRGADWTLLASEIKAIRASGLAPTQVNWKSVGHALLEGRLDESEATLYQGITRIPPGSSFDIDARGAIRVRSFWSLDNDICAPESNVVEQFAEIFESAVRLRMRSDVPVGVLLSGGMDSTAIICSMARGRNAAGEGGNPLLAFCYMAPQFDESQYINATLQQTQAQLHRLTVEPIELWEAMPRHLHFQDELVHSPTSMIGYKLMELARSNGVKVLLNGQGADEALGGYPSYFHTYWVSQLGRGRWTAVGRDIGKFVAQHGGAAVTMYAKAVRAMLQRRLRRLPGYERLSSTRRVTRLKANEWYGRPLQDALEPERSHVELMDLRDTLKHSVEVNPLPLYLRVEDRNSMAHSVEARLPFLDYRLVSLAFKLDDRDKLDAPWNKRILRKSMAGRMPENVRMRADKFGFPSPVDAWFRNEWYEPARDVLAQSALRDSGVCNVAAVRRDLERHKAGEISVGLPLFQVMQLASWLELNRKVTVA